MRFSPLASSLALLGSASAFSDSTPWMVLSTKSFRTSGDAASLQTVDTALHQTSTILSKCLTKEYAVVVQPGLHASDLLTKGAGKLDELIEELELQGSLTMSEVIGNVEVSAIEDAIEQGCGKGVANVKQVILPALPTGHARSATLLAHGKRILSELQSAKTSDGLTLIYVGTSSNAGARESQTLGQELKRDASDYVMRRAGNDTEWNKLPLFEKYQFFTPGIFMGIVAALVLGSILTVGLKALSSLEVSYGAFEKDMGPSAQKKQQ